MSISAQDLKQRLLLYYEKLDLAIEHVCARLQKNITDVEQKYQEDLVTLEGEQKAILAELERNYSSKLNSLKEDLHDAKKALAACINDREFLNRLKEILAHLYTTLLDHERVIDDVGLNKSRINLNSSPINIWNTILREARKNNKTLSVIELAMKEYPDNEELLAFRKQSNYDLLRKSYEERKRFLCEIVERQKNSKAVEIANGAYNYEERKNNLEKEKRDAIDTIATKLRVVQGSRKCWKVRLQLSGHKGLVSPEEAVVDSSFFESHSLGKINQIFQDVIDSNVIELHNRLFLTYIVYRLFLKGRGNDLLEMFESLSVTLDLLGGTLHSRLLHDPELDVLRLELEELLQPPYVTAWHKLPEPSTVNDAVIDCAISSEGNWVLTAHKDKTLKLWDVTTGMVEGEPLLHKTEIYDCDLSYNGVKAVTASADGLRLWHLIGGTEYDTPGSFVTTITKCCAFNQDSSQFIWGEGQALKGWIKALDSGITATSDYETVKLGQFHNQIIQSCAWAPYDKQVMAVAGSEIKIWDIEDDAVGYTFSNDGVYISCCAWRPDGTAIVFGVLDHTLKVWETTTNKVQHILVGHTEPVRGCVWSKSGEWIVSVSDDKTLKVWDANTGNCLSTFYADGPLTCCAIHADTQLVIAGGHKGVYWLKFNYNSRKDI